MTGRAEPRYAYQDPAALAWTAQMFRTARRRRLAAEAAEAQTSDPQCNEGSETGEGANCG